MNQHGDVGGSIPTNGAPFLFLFRGRWEGGWLDVFPGNVGSCEGETELLGSAGCFVVVEFGGGHDGMYIF